VTATKPNFNVDLAIKKLLNFYAIGVRSLARQPGRMIYGSL
jgi:hypothetical protein